jgi:transaldolase
MKGTRLLGAALLVAGILALAYGGFSYTRDKDKVNVGPIHISVEDKQRVSIPVWAGIAAFKRAYGIYRERDYRTRLLAAAYRHRLHWTELVGGDIVMTMPHAWQVRFNASGIAPESRIDMPVEAAIVDDLLARVPDFARAYEPDGLAIEEFASYGATARTLRSFIAGYHDLQAAVRDVVLPNPDVRPG